METIDVLLREWHSLFGPGEPEVIVRAPGRVNIIGEHTDYNEGYVLPGAMSKAVYILAEPISAAARKKEGNHWVSLDFEEELQFEKDIPANAPLWSKYIQGAIDMIKSKMLSDTSLQPIHFRLLIGGDLPIGAGVSSSSSLVCGVLYCLKQLHNTDFSKEELAVLGSRVEREIIGLQGGIMDQFAIMLSEKSKVMMLDCRDHSYTFYPAAIPGTRWVLINTKVKHQLIDSDYNQRANQCRQAVEVLKASFPGVKSLRDATLDMLPVSGLSEVLHQRCRFVIEENQRVEEMVKALSNKDAFRAGELLQQSHHGLQFLYEVSCEELDHLADIANTTEGVYGGRMMGGGFGGCVICLVKEEAMEVFLQKAISSYRLKFGFEPEVIEFELDSGVSMKTP